MMVKPWCKEAEDYFRRLAKDRVVYIKDTTFTRNFGRRYSKLINKDYLDIGRIDRKKESVITLRPGVNIEPLELNRKNLKFKFNRLF